MELKSFDTLTYNPTQEEVLKVLRTKTQNVESDLYFRVLACFYMSQMASNMRVTVRTPHRGTIPINLFACGLMESGGGKGHSMNIIEQELIKGFKSTFMKSTLPMIAEQNIEDAARTKSIRNQTDESEELATLMDEYRSLGMMPYSFDSGTGPAYKQIRTRAQIAGIGALSMICDEIGTNLLGNAELFAVNLEAYDVGLIKQKIIKNSSDNKRSEERDDPVPSNMLIFGTPSKLFNGGPEEREFYSLLETGYARRLLYGIGSKTDAPVTDAEELFDILTSHNNDALVDALASKFEALADPSMYMHEIVMKKPVALISLQYQINCEAAASQLSVYEAIRKAELQHRYFKAIKIAGAFAFIEGNAYISETNMYEAIKLVEDSGSAFAEILSRDKNYARVAKYIAEVKKEVTHADLTEDLPFYPSGKGAREDIMQLATAWSYRNNIILKKFFGDGGIEFFVGETLQETDINKLRVSYSDHLAFNFEGVEIPFSKLDMLTQDSDFHWANHYFIDEHRKEENVIPEFNVIVLDVDGGTKLSVVQELLKEYTYHVYTTKSHQKVCDKNPDGEDRFRIILPSKYHLKLDSNDFKEFMDNVYEWLPFELDTETNQRCKKWESFNGSYYTNEGGLLDPLPFIPKTARNEELKKMNQDLSSMDKVESWFARRIVDGNRNNTLLKFAMMLLDCGLSPDNVEDAVYSFNSKLKDGLTRDELQQTVLKSMWKKAHDCS